jgi:hypothetical protein
MIECGERNGHKSFLASRSVIARRFMAQCNEIETPLGFHWNGVSVSPPTDLTETSRRAAHAVAVGHAGE